MRGALPRDWSRLGDRNVTQKDVVVAPRLEVPQAVADAVNRDGVVEPELRLVVPDDPLQLLVLGLAHLGIGHPRLGDELLHPRVGVAGELLRARLGTPLAEGP